MLENKKFDKFGTKGYELNRIGLRFECHKN